MCSSRSALILRAKSCDRACRQAFKVECKLRLWLEPPLHVTATVQYGSCCSSPTTSAVSACPSPCGSTSRGTTNGWQGDLESALCPSAALACPSALFLSCRSLHVYSIPCGCLCVGPQRRGKPIRPARRWHEHYCLCAPCGEKRLAELQLLLPVTDRVLDRSVYPFEAILLL